MYALPLPRNFRPERAGWIQRRFNEPELGPHGPTLGSPECVYGRHLLRWEAPFVKPAILCLPYARSRYGYYSPPTEQEPRLLSPELLIDAVCASRTTTHPLPALRESA